MPLYSTSAAPTGSDRDQIHSRSHYVPDNADTLGLPIVQGCFLIVVGEPRVRETRVFPR
jgi:hypothetical protein